MGFIIACTPTGGRFCDEDLLSPLALWYCNPAYHKLTPNDSGRFQVEPA